MGGQSHRHDRDQVRLYACLRLRLWLIEELPAHMLAGAPPWPIDPYVDQDLRAYFKYLCDIARVNEIVPPGYSEAA
jgi:hypothetical protein